MIEKQCTKCGDWLYLACPTCTNFEELPGKAEVTLCGSVIGSISAAIIHEFRDLGADSFLTMAITDKKTGERYSINVQREGGQTPAEKISKLEAEIDSLRRKNELLCQTAERSVLLSRIEEIINGMESAPDADYYGEWDDGMYLAAPSDVLMYLKKALETDKTGD